ncbi:MAG: CinA family protein [Ancrocorticia sp.]
MADERTAVPRTDVSRSVAELIARGLTVGCAESLTGGALTSTFVSIPGVSEVLRGGIVSYASDVKASVLGVSRERLEETGPVDDVVALQMARGACRVLGADIGLSTTGVAGPGPADGHPAGTVWIAISGALGEQVRALHLSGDRGEIRAQTIACVLELLDEQMAKSL